MREEMEAQWRREWEERRKMMENEEARLREWRKEWNERTR